MPDLSDRRHAPRLNYDRGLPALLLLNGQECPVLDIAPSGVRYELPALPVRPAASAIFEGELRLACGERIPVMGRVVRTFGHVAAARIDPTPLTDLQLAREREHLSKVEPSPYRGPDRRRWRSKVLPMSANEPRRSEA